MNPFIFLYLLSISISISISLSSATTAIGVTYDPSTATSPPPDHVVALLHKLKISSVRLVNPTPASVRAFSYTNISIFLSIPNHFLPSFAANSSSASLYLYTTVLPFHPRTKISLISVGSDPFSSQLFDPTTTILPAVRNVHSALIQLGIKMIPVTTTFSFISIMTNTFPPSGSEFQEPVNSMVIVPLLRFLEETNSSFCVNLYPYNVYRVEEEIPVGFALFDEFPFNFRDDTVTGVRYGNLFDMMVDGVVAALAVSGKEDLPVVVAETGWPSDGGKEGVCAEMYLKGLVKHLRSGVGTPLRKEGVSEAYLYELFDKAVVNGTSDGGEEGKGWGIMYQNMTEKYRIDFSCGSSKEVVMGIGFTVIVSVLFVFWVVFC